MKEVADIITADSTGEWEMGKYTGRRTSPTHDEIAQLAFSCMSRVADRTGTTSRLAACRTGTRAALRVTAECRPKHTKH
jgi:hypothetical protein